MSVFDKRTCGSCGSNFSGNCMQKINCTIHNGMCFKCSNCRPYRQEQDLVICFACGKSGLPDSMFYDMLCQAYYCVDEFLKIDLKSTILLPCKSHNINIQQFLQFMRGYCYHCGRKVLNGAADRQLKVKMCFGCQLLFSRPASVLPSQVPAEKQILKKQQAIKLNPIPLSDKPLFLPDKKVSIFSDLFGNAISNARNNSSQREKRPNNTYNSLQKRDLIPANLSVGTLNQKKKLSPDSFSNPLLPNFSISMNFCLSPKQSVHNQQIHFKSQQRTKYFSLKNQSMLTHLVFKLETNNPQALIVKPAVGFVAASSTVEFSISSLKDENYYAKLQIVYAEIMSPDIKSLNPIFQFRKIKQEVTKNIQIRVIRDEIVPKKLQQPAVMLNPSKPVQPLPANPWSFYRRLSVPNIFQQVLKCAKETQTQEMQELKNLKNEVNLSKVRQQTYQKMAQSFEKQLNLQRHKSSISTSSLQSCQRELTSSFQSECMICTLPFNEEGLKPMQICLSQHVICQKDLESLIQRGDLHCPMCRQQFDPKKVKPSRSQLIFMKLSSVITSQKQASQVTKSSAQVGLSSAMGIQGKRYAPEINSSLDLQMARKKVKVDQPTQAVPKYQMDADNFRTFVRLPFMRPNNK